MIQVVANVDAITNMKTNDYFIEKVEQLLKLNASNEMAYNLLANEIAQKSVLLNHLYEDLGLDNRGEMNKLMNDNFKALAKIKPETIRWKKFLFDSIGEVAPACKYCYDQTNCFGCEIKINIGEKYEFSQNCFASI